MSIETTGDEAEASNSATIWLGPVLASALALSLGVWSVWWLSPTIDEWCYLHDGTRAWLGGRREALVDLGVLPLPFWIQNAPGALYLWARYGELPGGTVEVFRNSLSVHDQLVLLYTMRLTNLLVAGLGTIWSVWWLARRAFGPTAAAAASLFCALEPNLLASFTLGTTDAIALPPTLLAVIFYDDYLQSARAWKLLVAGLLFGLGLGMKVSILVQGLVVLGAFAVVPLIADAWAFPILSEQIRLLVRGGFRIAWQLGVIVVIGLLMSWAANAFLTDAVVNPTSSNERSYQILAKLGYKADEAKAIVDRLRAIQVPAPLSVFRWQFGHAMGGHVMTFRGVAGMHGPWYYYPYIFAMKTHLILLIAVIGSLALGRVWRSPILWSALLILAMSCTVKLHGSPRYFLLLYVLVLPLGGALVAAILGSARGWTSYLTIFAVIAVPSLALTIRSDPDFLTHTSPLWGGDTQGYLYADANYDWGQGLYLAQAAAKRKNLEPIRFINIGDGQYGEADHSIEIPRTTIEEVLPRMCGHVVGVSVFNLYHSGAMESPLHPLYRALVELGADGRLSNTYFYFDFRDPARFADLERRLGK